MQGWITAFYSRHLILPILFLLDRAARQDDGASRSDVGIAQPRLAQAGMWMLIIHLHAGGAFILLTSGRIKPTRNF